MIVLQIPAKMAVRVQTELTATRVRVYQDTQASAAKQVSFSKASIFDHIVVSCKTNQENN